jgi:hypothetical protein
MDKDYIILETINGLKDTIKTLRNVIFKKEELLYKLISYSQSNCTHDWIVDSIDKMNSYSESNIIKYCAKCELTE